MDNQLSQQPAQQIAFVFSNVAKYEQLVAAFRADVEVHILDAAQDGLAQMAAILAGRSGIGALHVVGHGARGSLDLGSMTLEAGNLAIHAGQLAVIGSALAPDGDILLYGCDVGADAMGAQFVGQLAQATGADVAASTDRTGGDQLGGDWSLEYRTGDIGADGAFDAMAVRSLETLLAPTVAEITGTMGIGNFVPGFTLTSSYVVSGDTENGVSGSIYVGDQNTTTANFTIAANGTTVGRFDLKSLAFLKPFDAFPQVEVTITGYRGATKVGTAILKSANNTTDFSTFFDVVLEGGDGFGDMTALTSFKVEIKSSTSQWRTWDLSFDSFTVDNVAPPAPGVPDLAAGSDLGASSIDNITSANAVDFAGTGVNGATVAVFIDKNGNGVYDAGTDVRGTTTVSGGAWTVAGLSSVGLSGSYQVYAQQTSSGVTSDLSTPLTVVFDHTSPLLTITSSKPALKIGETATVTFTFSEDPGSSFDISDIAVSGGTLSALAGSGTSRTAIFTPSANTDSSTATITVAANRFTDTAGNNGGAGATPSLSFDTKAPTVAVSSSSTALLMGQTATITFTFSEDPGASFSWDGSNGDLVVAGGTLSAIAGTGATRTATFTADGSNTTASIQVNAGSYTDTAGNMGGAAVSPNITVTIDNTPPAAPSVPDLDAGSDSGSSTSDNRTTDTTPTFIGTAEAGATVRLYDGASLVGTGSADGAGNWSITTSTLGAGTRSITAVATDAAGNTGAASAALSVTIDTTAPTLAVSSDKPSLKGGETATITFSFSEDPGSSFSWDGSSGDVAVSGGTLSAISGSGTTRTATFTPAANSTGSASIVVAAGAYADVAGNNGGGGATAISFDTMAPTLAISSSSSSLKVGETAIITFTFSENPGPTFSWNGSSGSLVVTGGTLGALSGSGAVRTALFTPDAGINGGTASITVAAGGYTDSIGNAGGAGASPSIIFDTLAPVAPSTPDLQAASDTGVSDSDNLTAGGSRTFAGTAEAGALVRLYDGATEIGSATATGGNWSITSTLAAGTHSVTAVAVDAAGNASSASGVLVVTVDASAPAMAISSSASALKAGQAAVITFTFTEDPGSSFVAGDIAVTGGTLGALTGSGTTRTAVFTPTAGTQGTASISVDAGLYADAAGNQAVSTSSLDIDVDTVVPTLVITSNSSALNVGETATITFTFSEDPGSSFTADDITVSGGTLGALSGSGAVRTAVFTPIASTNDGTASITVASGAYTDAAGNEGTAGATPALVFDTLAPATPGMPGVLPEFDSGTSNSDNLTDIAAPILTGTAEAGATVTLYDGATQIGSGVANSGGVWQIMPVALADGTHSITAVATDAAGNASAASTAAAITIDTAAPTLTISSDRAVLKAGETALITFSFSEDPGSSFYWDGSGGAVSVTGGTLSALSGAGATRTAVFTPDPDTPAGLASITVAGGYTDAAGNMGDAGAAPAIFFDTLAPGAPSTPDLEDAGDTGVSDSDNLTAGATQTFTGSAEDGTVVKLYDGATEIGSAEVSDGEWSITVSTLGEGSHSIVAVASDPVGNVSAASSALAVTVDRSAPTVAISSDASALKGGETAVITFTFSEDPGSSFVAGDIGISGGTLGELTGSGTTRTAVFTPTPNSQGSAVIFLTSDMYTDAAGNEGANSSSLEVAFDTAAPTLSISTDKEAMRAGETATITFTFSEDPGATFGAGDITVSGGTLGALSGTGATRTAVFTPTAGMNGGAGSITVAAGAYTDAAGNGGAAGATPTLVFDTLAPVAPGAPALLAGYDTGISGSDAVTNASAPVFTGTAEAGATVTLYDGASAIGSGVADAGGVWQIASSTLADGAHSISATATDAAGNASTAGTAQPVTVDTAAPTLAITSSHTALKAGETAVITFTFSEDPGATFSWDGVAGDIAVSGGTLGVLSGTGLVRTASFVATADTNAGVASISVPGGGYTDAAGNAGGAGAAPAITFDTLKPTLTIAASRSALKIGETAVITFTFSEDPGAIFGLGHISVSGGALSALSGSGTTRTAVFTPTAGASGTASVSVAAGSYYDAAGNGGAAADPVALAFDTLAPDAPLLALAPSSDSGASDSDQLTNDATPTFTGSAEDGATVTLYDTDGVTVIGTGVASGGTWSITASELGAGSHTVTARATDTAGNTGPASAALALTVDTSAPTLAITSGSAALKGGETALVTFTFSEDPGASFGAADIIVSGGTLGTLSGTGSVRTATFTPAAGVNAGTASITVAAGSYQDAAGNDGAAGVTPALVFDTLAPTLAISSSTAALKAGETATITFTFSEDPGASFGAGDITVTGGTLGALSGTGNVRTATFTPAPDTNASIASITVAGGAYTDAAGNAGGAGTTPSLSYDTLAPTVSITSDRTALKAGESAVITFTFSEDPGASFAWDGSAGDIAVSGGTLSAISGTGAVRTAVFTPVVDTNSGSAGITIASGAYADAAGNGGGAGTAPSITFDTLLPTLAITSDKSALRIGETAIITFTFSEDPGSTFDANDIAISGGTLGALGGTGTVRTALFTPAANTNGGAASIAVAGGVWFDAAGNGGDGAASVTLSFDTLAPSAPSAPVLAAADDTGTSGSDHITNRTSSTIEGTAEAGATVKLYDGATLLGTATADAGGAWSVNVAGMPAGEYSLVATATDAAGNVSAASAPRALVVDTAAPTLAITSDVSTLKAGEVATITFTFSEDPGATFAWGDIVVSGGTLGGLSGAGAVRTATFTPAAGTNSGSASITVPAGVYTDAAGNNGSAGATPSLTFDTLAPTLAITSSATALKAGESATITFTFSEDPGASFDSGDIVVSGGTLGAIAGSGAVRTAVFTPFAGVNGGNAAISVAAGSYLDAAGNAGAGAPGAALVFDTLAPAAPAAPALAAGADTGVSASDSLINRTTPTFTGTAEEGATVILYDGATAIGSTTVVGCAWTITSSALASGSHTITATATDAAGNVSAMSAGRDIVIDTAAPTLAISSSAASLGAGETATVTFTFSEDPGNTFGWDGSAGDIVVSGGTLSALAGTGNVRTAIFTPAANVNAGTAGISVAGSAYTDAAGNAGLAAAMPALTFDTLAPTLVITSSAPALASGEVALISFTFSEDPGASFSPGDITVTGGTLGALSGTGNVRTALFTPAPGTNNGSASISVGGVYTDAAGNAGAAAAALTLAFDTLAPAAPSAPVLAAGSDTGELASDGLTRAATPTFSGTAESGATITLYGSDGITVIGTGTAIDGKWNITTGVLADGPHTITARATDAAGNTSAPSPVGAIAIDTSAPSLAINSDVSALRTGQSATITFTFSEDPGSSFTLDDLVVEGGTLGALSGSGNVRSAVFTPAAGSSGSASIALAAGAYADLAGNGGAAASLPSLAFDTLAPTVAITSSATSLRSGESATITFTFSEDPGASFGIGDVAVSGGMLGALSGTGTVRTATFTPAANTNAGTASITVAAGAYQDAAGNAGAAGASPALVFDTLAPGVTVASSRAALKAGETATITFTFSEDPGASFGADDLVVNGGTLGPISGSGNVRTAVFTPAADSEGGASIAVAGAYADAAGNSGGPALDSIWVDTRLPAAPSAPLLVPGSDTGSSATDGVTRAQDLTFSGSAEMGATVVLVDTATGAHLGTTVATSGTWSITVAGMAEGTLNVAAVATDAAGNVSVRSAATAVTVDRSAPAALSLSLVTDSGTAGDHLTNSGSVRVDGLVAGAAWEYSADGGASWKPGSGSTLTLGADGNYSLVARQVDAAGNAGPASAPLAFTLDTAKPVASVTMSDYSLVYGETATVTIAFDEAVYGFDAADIAAAHGSLSGLGSSDGGRTWTALFTPALDIAYATNVISVSNAGVTDAAGNAGAGASASPNYSVLTNGLRSSIELSDTELKAGETSIVTIRFSQRVSGFTASDLNVANGVVSGLASSDGGRTWTATLIPAASTADTTNVITLAHSTVFDASGKAGTGSSSSVNYEVNTVRPTVSITVSDKTMAPGDTALVTFSFSEAVNGFTGSDLTVVGGAVSGLASADGGRTWTATLTVGDVTGSKPSQLGYVKVDMTGLQNDAGNTGVGNVVSAPYLVASAGSARFTVDGATTYSEQVTLPGTGLSGNLVTVPAVSASRQDDPGTPNSSLADITVGTPAGAGNSLTVSLPSGVGLQAEGPAAPLTTPQALLDLIGRIESRTTSGTSSQADMSGAGSNFLSGLGQGTGIESRTISLFADPAAAAGQPIVVSGLTPSPAGSQPTATALVIDGSALPGGSVLQLDNVDFAAIIGNVQLHGGAGRNYVVGDGASQNIFLGAEDDTLSGGAGNDFIGSAGGDDHLDGGDDDDLVVGGIGNDTVIGGAGNDVLNGGRSVTGTWDFFVSASGALSARHGGAVFTLGGTETVQGSAFDGAAPELGFLGADAGHLVGVSLLYGALGRAPDLGGLTFWSRAGVSLADVAAGVLRSAEWGDTPLGQAGDEAFVRGMYQDLLGREVDAGGLAFWLAALAGNSGNHATRADVLLAVALSTEHRDGTLTADGYAVGHAQLAQERAWFGGSGDDRLVGGAGNDQLVGGDGFDTAVFSGNRADYRFLVGADDIVRVSHLPSGDIDTLSGIEAAQFGDGTIDLSFLEAGLARIDTVGLLYQAVLDRAGDSAGLEWWLGLDVSTAQLAQFFTATTEFTARYGAMDDASFVQALYANSGLDGEVAGGMQAWQDYLGSHTRAELVAQWIAQDSVVAAQFAGGGLWLL